MEIAKGSGVKSRQESQNEKPFKQGKEEGEEEPGKKPLQIEPIFEEMSEIKEEGSRKSIEAKGISRKEIHQIP